MSATPEAASLPPAPAPEKPARPKRAFGGHMPALDGVRGLAILMVLLFHFVANTTATNAFERAAWKVLNYGSLGVDLFFVLSGFLITGILYDSRERPSYFRNFYMRRVLRIFPLYYFVLAVVFLLVPLVPALRGSEIATLREHQLWAWLYGVNVYLSIQGAWALSYLDHFWSLAVEEHFYLVWPFVVWLLARRPRRLMTAALVVAATSFLARVAASVAGTSIVATTVLTPFQLDALCLGGFFAVWLRQPEGEAGVRRTLVPLALVAGAVALLTYAVPALVAGSRPLALPVRGGAFRVLFAVVLLSVLFAPAASLASAAFRSRPMMLLGKYSYGLYVYHHFLSFYATHHRTDLALAGVVGSHTLAVLLQATAGITVSAAVAWASYEWLEKPFLELKRFWPSAGDSGRAKAA